MPKRAALLAFPLLVCVLLIANLAAWAGPGYYMEAPQADLAHVLAPPPPTDSVEGKADLMAVLIAQQNRTKTQVNNAKADSDESVLRFADVMGPGFDYNNLPFANGFFGRLSSDADEAVAAAKAHFNRPRPFVLDRHVEPVVGKPFSPSYPGGHATFAYVNAIVLADMVPEKANAIFNRARSYANNRVIGGVHYPTDSEAGLISASVIANVLLHEPRFLKDFARARAEVRHAVGLSADGLAP
jgi:acid phosphatase (class A)